MAGLIQQLTDITLTATPSVGSYLLSIDLDGVLKYKTDTGTISPVGGSITQTGTQSLIGYFPDLNALNQYVFGGVGTYSDFTIAKFSTQSIIVVEKIGRASCRERV